MQQPNPGYQETQQENPNPENPIDTYDEYQVQKDNHEQQTLLDEEIKTPGSQGIFSGNRHQYSDLKSSLAKCGNGFVIALKYTGFAYVLVARLGSNAGLTYYAADKGLNKIVDMLNDTSLGHHETIMAFIQSCASFGKFLAPVCDVKVQSATKILSLYNEMIGGKSSGFKNIYDSIRDNRDRAAVAITFAVSAVSLGCGAITTIFGTEKMLQNTYIYFMDLESYEDLNSTADNSIKVISLAMAGSSIFTQLAYGVPSVYDNMHKVLKNGFKAPNEASSFVLWLKWLAFGAGAFGLTSKFFWNIYSTEKSAIAFGVDYIGPFAGFDSINDHTKSIIHYSSIGIQFVSIFYFIASQGGTLYEFLFNENSVTNPLIRDEIPDDPLPFGAWCGSTALTILGALFTIITRYESANHVLQQNNVEDYLGSEATNSFVIVLLMGTLLTHFAFYARPDMIYMGRLLSGKDLKPGGKNLEVGDPEMPYTSSTEESPLIEGPNPQGEYEELGSISDNEQSFFTLEQVIVDSDDENDEDLEDNSRPMCTIL